MSKETWYMGKRDLVYRKKRPTETGRPQVSMRCQCASESKYALVSKET